MWTPPSYDIIVETLTGSEFEVTVQDRTTVGYLKSEIQKYEGIPISQQHLLYNHKELSDGMEMKDIPLVKGSRIKLVLGMKGGPISSKRLFTISSDYDNWLDMSDVLSGEDLINLQSPGLKLLLYKDNKKNVHRLMKVRAEKACDGMKGSMSRSIIGSGVSGQGAYGPGGHMSQKERDAAITKQVRIYEFWALGACRGTTNVNIIVLFQKMQQIKAKLRQKKKRLGTTEGPDEDDLLQEPASVEQFEERPGTCSNDVAADVGGKAIRNPNHQYRHKKRHHQYHHHHHHHHQHETVIKEEKTPIGYRPPGGGGGTTLVASGHTNPSIVGTIGSMLPGAAGGPAASTQTHRKSMPAVIDIGGRSEQEQAAVPPFSYGLVNLLHGTGMGRSPTLEQEKRSQIREHLQRNRSFKTISSKNLDFARESSPQLSGGAGGGGGGGGGGGDGDGISRDRLHHSGSAGLERSLSFHSNGILNRMDSESTLDGGAYSNSIRRCGGGHTRTNNQTTGTRLIGTTQSLHKLDESRVSSASLHDLIELLKYTQSKQQQRTISNDSLNKLMLNYSKKVYVPHHPHHLYHHPPAGKKSLPDINPSLNNIDEYLPDYDYGLMKAAPGATTTATKTTATAGGGGAIPKLVARSEDGLDCKIASAEYAFKNAGGGTVDKTFRTLYKSTSDDSSVYELPKLLIREDSPVESFLGSYSQLETVATRRGDSPKNNFTSTVTTAAATRLPEGSVEPIDSETNADASATGLLELRSLTANSATSTSIVGEAKLATESLLQLAQIAATEGATSNGATTLFGSNGSLTNAPVGGGSGATLMGTTTNGGSSSSTSWYHWNHRLQQQPQHHHHHHHHDGPFTSSSLQHLHNPPRHHHSDLGINELGLKFVHGGGGGAAAAAAAAAAGNSDTTGEYTNMIKLPALSNLEAGNGWLQLSSWDTVRFGREEDEDADDEEVLDEDEIRGQEEEEEDDDDDEEEDDDDDDDDDDEEEDDDDDEGVEDVEEVEVEQDRVTPSSCSSSVRRRPRDSSNSTSFIHSHLSISSDEDDLLNGPELRVAGATGGAGVVGGRPYKPGGNKSKSIDLNECRKAFGSSPTLLNGFGGGGVGGGTSCTRLVPQLSRLETIPSQYRRGYTNLNDACLSSSTSELECVSNGAAAAGKKKHSGTSGLLPPSCDRSVPYVRSNESLNRYKVSLCATAGSSSARRRHLGDSDDGGLAAAGSDALYLRQRQPSSIGRHLPSIRDHLASIADEALDGAPARSNVPEGTGHHHHHHRDDLECQFARLSCCSVPEGEDAVSNRAVGSGGGGGGGRSLMRTTSSASADDRSRFLFCEDASSASLRPSDYYFPSDESLFNMDSFFDDFVEIDTSDIFEGADFVNLNTGGSAGRKGGENGGLILPDVRTQQQQQEQLLNQQGKMLRKQHQLQVVNSFKSYTNDDDGEIGKQRLRAAESTSMPNSDGSDSHFSVRQAFLQAGRDNIDEEEGVASIIQHIDRERLCGPQRCSVSTHDLTSPIASSIVTVHQDDKERLLRLTDDYPVVGGSDLNALRQNPTSPPPATAPQHHTTEQIKSKKLRCAQCNKKLGVIMIMKCHCEKIFCAQHRYAEAHNCSYDFKVEGRKVLEKNNPLVVADKLPKI
uniref:AN1-type domain-containing protein n=1 Tax=Anopheles dirus TaxID=7168 RepID=A0A182NLI2_9DIPT